MVIPERIINKTNKKYAVVYFMPESKIAIFNSLEIPKKIFKGNFTLILLCHNLNPGLIKDTPENKKDLTSP